MRSTKYLDLIEAMVIFQKYHDPMHSKFGHIQPEHDQLYAGPSLEEGAEGMDEDDVARLEQLGWYYDEDASCFVKGY